MQALKVPFHRKSFTCDSNWWLIEIVRYHDRSSNNLSPCLMSCPFSIMQRGTKKLLFLAKHDQAEQWRKSRNEYQPDWLLENDFLGWALLRTTSHYAQSQCFFPTGEFFLISCGQQQQNQVSLRFFPLKSTMLSIHGSRRPPTASAPCRNKVVVTQQN